MTCLCRLRDNSGARCEDRPVVSRGLATALIAVLAGSGAAHARSTTVTTIAQWHGGIAGLAQDADDVAWCSETAGYKQTIHLRRLQPPGERTFPASTHGQIYCGGSERMETARGSVGWGGYEEVRCSDTHWAVYVARPTKPVNVQTTAHDCLGYGTTFAGLATDGTSILYGTARYTGDDFACSDSDRCFYRLTGGGVYRIAGKRAVRIPNVPPAGKIAAGDGLVAVAQPLSGGPYSYQSGPVPPAAAHNPLITTYRSSDGTRVSQVRASGDVDAMALTGQELVVRSGRTLTWYDVRTGSLAGSALAAQGLDITSSGAISASGTRVVYVARHDVHVLDLQTKSDTIVWHGTSWPLSPSIVGTRVVWAVEGANTSAILSTDVG